MDTDLECSRSPTLDEIIEAILTLDVSVQDLKLNYIRATLAKCRGNKNEASRILGINRRHLSVMIRRYEWEEFKGWREGSVDSSYHRYKACA